MSSSPAPTGRFSLRWLAVVGVSLFIFFNFFAPSDQREVVEHALPLISVEQAAAAAEQFATGRHPQSQWLVAPGYSLDELFSGYIQRYRLQEKFAQSWQAIAPAEYFRIDLRDEEQRIRYMVDVHMQSGRVIGWSRQYSANLPDDRHTAEAAAQAAIVQAGLPADAYVLHQVDMTGEQNRPPFQKYVYSRAQGTMADAQLLLEIAISGGEPVSFRHYFEIPEEHRQWQTRQSLNAEVMTVISLALSLAMFIAALVHIVQAKHIRYSRGLLFTISFALLFVLNQWNTLEGSYIGAGYFFNAEQTRLAYAFTGLLTVLLAAQLYASLAAGDTLWRQQGRELWPHWRSPGFSAHLIRSMKVGYLAALLLLGVQAMMFYFAEVKLDSWAINDASMSVYNMMWPAVFPLLAWVAAISEEAVVRLFGIAWLQKLFKRTFPAVLATSMIWALGHTAYPIFPSYIRFIEVTVLGILFGYLFLKHGFLAAVFAHAAVDSVLMALTMAATMPEGKYILLAIVYIASPALVAWLLALCVRWRIGQRFDNVAR